MLFISCNNNLPWWNDVKGCCEGELMFNTHTLDLLSVLRLQTFIFVLPSPRQSGLVSSLAPCKLLCLDACLHSSHCLAMCMSIPPAPVVIQSLCVWDGPLTDSLRLDPVDGYPFATPRRYPLDIHHTAPFQTHTPHTELKKGSTENWVNGKTVTTSLIWIDWVVFIKLSLINSVYNW